MIQEKSFTNKIKRREVPIVVKKLIKRLRYQILRDSQAVATLHLLLLELEEE